MAKKKGYLKAVVESCPHLVELDEVPVDMFEADQIVSTTKAPAVGQKLLDFGVPQADIDAVIASEGYQRILHEKDDF